MKREKWLNVRRNVSTLLTAISVSSCVSDPNIAADSAVPSVSSARTAADLQVVDCLLSGQVRKLGQQMTFLTAGRAIKTTASDCEIRGGQYVAYDRSNYATALNVWLPQAQAGDQAAQNYVGEIYEKGLGTAPDYAQAAQWYRKAAEQGNNRAQINLGYLFEKGLGVEQNLLEALNWYRKASGLGTDVALDSGEAASLRQDLAQSRRNEASLREQLQSTRQQLEKAQQDLRRRRADAAMQEQRWEQQKSTLLRAQQQATVSGDDVRVRSLQAQITARSEEAARNRAEIERLERVAAGYREQVGALEREGQTAKQMTTVEKQKSANAGSGAKSGVAERDESATEKMTDKDQVAAVHRLDDDLTGPSLEFVGPKIEIIEPPITLNRGIGARIKADAGTGHLIVGKATSSLGIKELTVNDKVATLDDQGLFKTPISVQSPDTPVEVVAIDKGGKRANVEFVFVVARGIGIAGPASATPPVAQPVGSFGTYHALLIGNNEYSSLPTLNTPVRDIQEIGNVLRSKYGFRVKTLANATRFQILSALHEMRESLTANDNLIVYYAGHGELDKVNHRGHWLPVDAQRDNPSNWISNVDVTDTINLMPAKHVLVIADSCYSGTLTQSALTPLTDRAAKSEKSNWYRTVGGKRSRTVLSSGGEAPVPDSGGEDPNHSLFAGALLQVLKANADVLEGAKLYREVAARVAYAARRAKVQQVPAYAPVKYAGHEAGDFLLVPAAAGNVQVDEVPTGGLALHE